MTTYLGATFASLIELINFMNTSGLAMPVPIDPTKIVNTGFDSNSGFFWIIYKA